MSALCPSRCGDGQQHPPVRTPPNRGNHYQQSERFEPQRCAWFLYGTARGNRTATETEIPGASWSFRRLHRKVRCIGGMIVRRSYEDSAMNPFRSTHDLQWVLFGV